MPDQQNNNIDRYLNGEMSPEETQRFELALADDPLLREQVGTQQQLKQFFQTRAPELEKQLEQLGEQYFRPKKNYRIIWLVLSLVVVLLLGGYFLWPRDEPEADVIASPTIEKKTDSLLVAPPVNLPPLSDTAAEIQVREEVPTVPERAPEAGGKQPVASPPIAEANIDYTPNPLLENLIRERVRGNDAYYEWQSPPIDTVISLSEQVGFIVTGHTTSNVPFEFRLYGNLPEDFLEDKRLMNQTIAGESRGGDTLNINAKVALPAKRGLYYWLIVSKGAEDLRYGGKVSIQ